MADPQEEQQRRSTQFDPMRQEDFQRVRAKAESSKRLKDPGKLRKNVQGKTPGKPRSGSDSNASRRTRGH